MGLLAKLSIVLVFGSLIAGIVMNVLVLSSCEFMSGSSVFAGDEAIKLGVFRFSVDDPNSDFNTSGECENYDKWADDDVPRTVRTAQVCAVLAPSVGLTLLLLLFMHQFCCSVPCMNSISSLLYFGAQLGTSLVWFVRRNDLCESIVGGCEWGDAAVYNLVAHVLYIVAAIMQRFLPDRSQGRRSPDEGKGKEATVSSNNAGSAEVDRLQNELDQQTQRANELESRVQGLSEDNDKKEKALAAATAATSTAAAAEAARIKQLEDELSKKKTEYDSKLRDLENDNSKKEKALAAATAATSTAAAAEAIKIKELQDEVNKQKLEFEARIEELTEDNKAKDAALAGATAATSAAAAAEAAEIKRLKDELEGKNKVIAEYEAQIDELKNHEVEEPAQDFPPTDESPITDEEPLSSAAESPLADEEAPFDEGGEGQEMLLEDS